MTKTEEKNDAKTSAAICLTLSDEVIHEFLKRRQHKQCVRSRMDLKGLYEATLEGPH